MVLVDVPMYYQRALEDLAAGRAALGFRQGRGRARRGDLLIPAEPTLPIHRPAVVSVIGLRVYLAPRNPVAGVSNPPGFFWPLGSHVVLDDS